MKLTINIYNIMEKIKYNDEYCGSVAASNNNDNNINSSSNYHFDCGTNAHERWVVYNDFTAENLYNWFKASKGKFPITIKEVKGLRAEIRKTNNGWCLDIWQIKDYVEINDITYFIAKRLTKKYFNHIIRYIMHYIDHIMVNAAPATETNKVETEIDENLVISAIKDAIKTNSTDEYSVGGGYTISINDEKIKVSVPDENRTIDYRISDYATEDEWLFNKEEVIKKIASDIVGDIYINPNGYDGVPTFEQSQFAVSALMEDNNAPATEPTTEDYDEGDYAEVVSTESGVWYIESDINIEDYMENGYDKPLPEEVQNWLHDQENIVCYDSYPYYKDHKVIDHAKRITSPKTYGDLIKPYVDYLAEIDKEAANDSSWECLHTPDCLWVEGFKIEAKLSRLIKNNAFAEIYIGS